MNEPIRQFLSDYIVNPDPQYAVMLKGKWGCGKTHFVKEWLKTIKPDVKDDNYITLEPVYISVYGMTSVTDIKKALDREINPFFYSSTGKIVKNIGKLLGQIAFRTSLDIDGTGHNETSLSATLDSFAIYKSDSDEVTGTKLLIFDDIERCQIGMKQLLGFINSFVEHCGCHVIIIGDEEKLGETKQAFDDFKEKTIGREFEVLPDVESAIDCFISEVPICDYLIKQRDYIIQCFRASQNNNLRILRQCLYDFSNQLSKIDDIEYSEDNIFLHDFLGSFIAVYFEYANATNKALLTKLSESYHTYLTKDDTQNSKIREVQAKYSEVSKNCVHHLLCPEYTSVVLGHISQGVDIVKYIHDNIINRPKELLPWEKFQRFIDLTQKEFDEIYDTLIDESINFDPNNCYPIGTTTAFFSYIHIKGIRDFKDDDVNRIKAELHRRINELTSLKDLYQLRTNFIQGCNYVEYEKSSEDILTDIVNEFEHEINKKKEQLPDDMQIVIRNLSDENVDSLFEIDRSSYPDGSSNYEMRPIFANEDASNLFNSIKAMSNKSRNIFCTFLASHYGFRYQMSDVKDRYKEDRPVLVELKYLIDKEIEVTKSLDKYVFQLMSRDLSRCIKRTEGEIRV